MTPETCSHFWEKMISDFPLTDIKIEAESAGIVMPLASFPGKEYLNPLTQGYCEFRAGSGIRGIGYRGPIFLQDMR